MKKLLLQTSCLALIVFACACGPSFKVSSDYDKAADFTKYKTFALYKADTINAAISDLNRQRVISALRSEMTKKGLTENTTSPDLLVNAVAIFKDKVAVSSNTDYYGYGGYYRPYYWGAAGGASSYTSYNVQHYKDGSLIIDLVDANSKALVWQGVGNSEIDGPIKDPDVKIPKAVAAIMQSFPPKAGKK